MSNTQIPAADAPDWGGPYNFAWFRLHHLNTLREHLKALQKLYKTLPLGKGVEPDTIQEFLGILDKLIQLQPWLPETSGGGGSMREIKAARLKFEKDYVGAETIAKSFWELQEIISEVFSVVNYMEAVCEE